MLFFLRGTDGDFIYVLRRRIRKYLSEILAEAIKFAGYWILATAKLSKALNPDLERNILDYVYYYYKVV